MGIARGAARLILEECSKRPFEGSILQLGRQKFFFNEAQFRTWAPLHNIQLVEDIPIEKGSDTLVSGDNIDDKTFFYRLGFEKVESADYSDFQEADHIFDLNHPVPDYLHDKFDVIVDMGTIEHVFNISQVLKNLHNMLKVGGRIIHMLPSSNWVDHGFYMFSPTLFYDYYTANKWKIETSRIIELTRRHNVDPWRIYEYLPGSLNFLSSGGFDKGYLINVFFVVTKETDSVSSITPQQSRYEKGKWDEQYSSSNTKTSGLKVIGQYIIGPLKSFPLLYSVLISIFTFVTRKKRMPRIIAKY